MNKMLQDCDPYSINFPKSLVERIESDFNQKIKDCIKDKLKKSIEEVREEIESEVYARYSDNLRYFIDQIILDKAKALVVGLLEGDRMSLRTFIDFGYSREKILESVVDYTAKIEVENLKKENSRLRESLDLHRGNYR